MNEELKTFWDRFEIKFLLCCTAYKERFLKVEPELARVGIENYIVQWDVPDTPLKTILHRSVRTNRHLRGIGPFSCFLQHYKAMKTAYALGCASVLILEDDIRFHKDVQFIKEVHTMLPADYDYAQFEQCKPADMDFKEYLRLKDTNIVNQYWRRFANLRGGGCYAMSRKAMEKILSQMESRINGVVTPVKINDFYVSQVNDINKYFCYPSVAVQCPEGPSNSNMDKYWRRCAAQGMERNQYNIQGDI